MHRSTQLPFLMITNVEEKGRCIITTEEIKKGSIIEVCPVIVISLEETSIIHKTKLHDYYFVWDIVKGSSAIALGYGSLYNHSNNNNADFEVDFVNDEIKIYASTDILAGEEITINYKGPKEENNPLWFDEKP